MDEIDELVDYQLSKSPSPPKQQEKCPNCKVNPWHGTPSPSCYGSHLPPDKAKRRVVGDMSLGYFILPNFQARR